MASSYPPTAEVAPFEPETPLAPISPVLVGVPSSSVARRIAFEAGAALRGLGFEHRCEIASAVLWGMKPSVRLAPRLGDEGSRRALAVVCEAFYAQSLQSLAAYASPQAIPTLNLSLVPGNLLGEAARAVLLPWIVGIPTVAVVDPEGEGFVQAIVDGVARYVPPEARLALTALRESEQANRNLSAWAGAADTLTAASSASLTAPWLGAFQGKTIRWGTGASAVCLSRDVVEGAGLGLLVSANDIVSDVVASDQRSTLSPRLVVVEGSEGDAIRVAKALAQALTRAHVEVPMGRETRRERDASVAFRRTVRDAGGAMIHAAAGAVAVVREPVLASGVRNLAVLGTRAPAEALRALPVPALRIGVSRDERDLLQLVNALSRPRPNGSVLHPQIVFIGQMHRPPITTWLDGKRPLAGYFS